MKISAGAFTARMLTIGATLGLLFAQTARACTGIRLTAGDGAVIHARTLEFAVDLQSEVILAPRGFSRSGTTPDGKPGKRWTAKYASLGANGVSLPFIFDGLNEKGLAIGLFYFPGSAKYQAYTSSNARKTIAPWELGSYILENFSTIEEVKKNVPNVIVGDVVFEAWKFVPPVHYVVTDATGKTIVIEYVGGRLNIHDNPLGVITNSPTFDWHMTNLRNYVNFSLTNHPPVQLEGVKLEPLGQGSGMLGMPGDFTPPSRFVRAVAFSQSTLPSSTGSEAVLQAFHILNNFDIPKGAARERQKDEHGNIVADYTIWTSAIDLHAKQFYFRTHENSQIRMIDLMRQKLDGDEIVKWSMKGSEAVKDLSAP